MSSRVAFVTGRSPFATGAYGNEAWQHWEVDAVPPTFPELLAAAGYGTVNLGKQHLPTALAPFELSDETNANQTALIHATRVLPGEVVAADLSDRGACYAAIGAAVDTFGRLDVLCNVAGVNRPGLTPEVTQADWDFVLDVNLAGTFWCCQAALPHLLETEGVIVNTASNTAVQGLAYFAAYCASRGGVVALTRALAMEYARTGIRINAVAPGGTDTPLSVGVARDLPESIDWDLLTRGVGLRGDSTPDDVARVIAWVASPDAKVMHGAVVHADQGLTTG